MLSLWSTETTKCCTHFKCPLLALYTDATTTVRNDTPKPAGSIPRSPSGTLLIAPSPLPRRAEIGGIPLAELNALELAFLLRIGFRLTLSPEAYARRAAALVRFAARRRPNPRSTPASPPPRPFARRPRPPPPAAACAAQCRPVARHFHGCRQRPAGKPVHEARGLAAAAGGAVSWVGAAAAAAAGRAAALGRIAAAAARGAARRSAGPGRRRTSMPALPGRIAAQLRDTGPAPRADGEPCGGPGEWEQWC
jgi:hypothetical protein